MYHGGVTCSVTLYQTKRYVPAPIKTVSQTSVKKKTRPWIRVTPTDSGKSAKASTAVPKLRFQEAPLRRSKRAPRRSLRALGMRSLPAKRFQRASTVFPVARVDHLSSKALMKVVICSTCFVTSSASRSW